MRTDFKDGELMHFEVSAVDSERARAFWGDLFGWTFSRWSGPTEYWRINTPDGPDGGLFPNWRPAGSLVPYFYSSDIEAATARVVELGGLVHETKFPLPKIGWIAHCSDSEGNHFSLFEIDPSVPAALEGAV